MKISIYKLNQKGKSLNYLKGSIKLSQCRSLQFTSRYYEDAIITKLYLHGCLICQKNCFRAVVSGGHSKK